MSDEIRPKFVGIFEGDFAEHGPAQRECGVWLSATYGGSKTWAVDERGHTYNYCRDLSKREITFVWVRVPAAIVYDPGKRTSIP